jgi:hypothetical protein
VRPHRALIAACVLLAARGLARAQEAPPQYFEEPQVKPHLVFQWDALARYDNVEHWGGFEPIDRGRFEVRPQLDLVLTPELRFGVRASFNYGTLPNEYNALYEDNWVSRAAYLDRYFVSWTPGAWTFQGGAFALPVAASPMLWDKYNIQTPGASASYFHQLGPTSSLTFTAAGIYSAQHFQDESILGVGQVLWRAGDENRFAIEASLAFWNMDMRHVAVQYFRQNQAVFVDGHLQYRSKFQLIDNLVKLQFPAGGLPVTVSLDFIHNFGVVGYAGSNAYEAGVMVGTVGTPRTWRAFLFYQYTGQDALVGAYNTDEWWWHTWAKGYRFGASYTILSNVYLEPAMVVQQRLDLHYWVTRVMVSLVKMF